jgi:hypothetical protein
MMELEDSVGYAEVVGFDLSTLSSCLPIPYYVGPSGAYRKKENRGVTIFCK